MKLITKIVCCFSVLVLIAGCSTVSGNKKVSSAKKVNKTIEAKNAGKGATKEQVIAAWGNPSWMATNLNGQEVYGYDYYKIYTGPEGYIPVLTMYIPMAKYKGNTLEYTFDDNGIVTDYVLSEDKGKFPVKIK